MTVDFHSHVLPGIDDGSSGIEESLALMALQARQGIDHTVATPHFYPEHQRFEDFLHNRAQAEEALRRAMEGKEGLPKLTVGAEVHFFSGMSGCEELKQLTIGSGCFILIEMPYRDWSRRMYQELSDVSAKLELAPVIAHVDRYLGAFSDRGIPEKLMEAGCLIQANASAFLAPLPARLNLRMLRKGQIHLLGSDCHNLHSRPPRLGEALEKIRARLGDSATDWLEGWSERVLSGT